MRTLHRLTTEYSATEDRIRLAGEDASGAPLALWLTRRLLDQLVAHLVQWLEQRHANAPRRDALLEFAQHAAVGQLPAQAPVRATHAPASLVEAIDVTANAELLQISFKAATQAPAGMCLGPTQLRQWLAILHRAYLSGGWPTGVWPAWVADGSATSAMPAPAVMH